jgi:hypothetical protein
MREHTSRACLAIALGLLWMAPARLVAQAPSCAGGFDVRVPDGWRTAERLMLLAKDVSAPKNRTAVLEFSIAHGQAEPVRLGSYGIVAESEAAAGRWSFEVVRVNVTRPMRGWLETHPHATTVCVRMDVIDADRRPLPGLDWTARGIEITAVKAP